MIVTPRGLERQGKQAYEGWGYRMFLANDPAATLNNGSLAADWLALEVSGNGYEPVTGVVAAGSFNTGNGRWEQPTFPWEFSATGAGYTFTHRCLQFSKITSVGIAEAFIGSGVATIKTDGPHIFQPGDTIVIAGATGDYNGTKTVFETWAQTDSYLSFNTTAADAAPDAVGGTITRVVPELYLEAIREYSPAVLLAAGQSRSGSSMLAKGT